MNDRDRRPGDPEPSTTTSPPSTSSPSTSPPSTWRRVASAALGAVAAALASPAGSSLPVAGGVVVAGACTAGAVYMRPELPPPAPLPETPALQRFVDSETGVLCFIGTYRGELAVACGFGAPLIPSPPYIGGGGRP